MWTFPSFESVRQDVQFALRTLRKAPKAIARCNNNVQKPQL